MPSLSESVSLAGGNVHPCAEDMALEQFRYLQNIKYMYSTLSAHENHLVHYNYIYLLIISAYPDFWESRIIISYGIGIYLKNCNIFYQPTFLLLKLTEVMSIYDSVRFAI